MEAGGLYVRSLVGHALERGGTNRTISCCLLHGMSAQNLTLSSAVTFHCNVTRTNKVLDQCDTVDKLHFSSIMHEQRKNFTHNRALSLTHNEKRNFTTERLIPINVAYAVLNSRSRYKRGAIA